MCGNFYLNWKITYVSNLNHLNGEKKIIKFNLLLNQTNCGLKLEKKYMKPEFKILLIKFEFTKKFKKKKKKKKANFIEQEKYNQR